eukprot:jgi/Chlat1/3293/Chrsp22S03450
MSAAVAGSLALPAPARSVRPCLRLVNAKAGGTSLSSLPLRSAALRSRRGSRLVGVRASAQAGLDKDYFRTLPSDVKQEVRDAAWALTSSVSPREAGAELADALAKAGEALEGRADAQDAHAAAETIKRLVPSLPEGTNYAGLARRLTNAARSLKTAVNALPAGSRDNAPIAELARSLDSSAQTVSEKAKTVPDTQTTGVAVATPEWALGPIKVTLTPEKALVGAGISVVFGILSYYVTSNFDAIMAGQADSYANSNALVLAQTLRGAALVAGYGSAVLSVIVAAGLVALALSGKRE